MRTTIDKAGRIVIPKALRDRAGLVAGEVEVTVDGAGIRIEAPTGSGFVRKGSALVIPAGGGPTITDDDVRELRLADQR